MDGKKLAIDELNNSEYKLIVVKEDEIMYKSKEESVSSIVHLLDNNPKLLKNSIVADKVIGRAVAMVCDYASVEFCYGSIMSSGAVKVFEKSNIPYKTKKEVKQIRNIDDTDLCPIEKLILEVDNSRKGIEKIKEFLNNKKVGD
ncbi:MAG: DUF1893 domain-containing protein [Halanaerobiales bacterium]